MRAIYLACPFSHKHFWVRYYRFFKVTRLAAKLIKEGICVYSPITMSLPVNLIGRLPSDWRFWKKHDEKIISLCDELFVFTLPGWENSEGVWNEIKMGISLGMTITYINKEYQRVVMPHAKPEIDDYKPQLHKGERTAIQA